MSDMLKILKRLDTIQKKSLKESKLTECPPDMPSAPKQPMSINISGDSSDIAAMLKTLSGIESGSNMPAMISMEPDGADMPMPMPGKANTRPEESYMDMEELMAGGDDIHAEKDPADIRIKDASAYEGYDNEPEESVMDMDMDQMSGGINSKKKSYRPASQADNAMAVESIKTRLLKALSEKKSKPDFLDVDKDGDKKEPMKKAAQDAKKGSTKDTDSKTKGLSDKQKKLPAGLQKAIAKKKTNEGALDEAYVNTSKDAMDTLSALRKIGKSIERGQGSYEGNLANIYANDVYDVYSFIEKQTNGFQGIDKNVKAAIDAMMTLRGQAKKMEREPGSGKNARFGNDIATTLYPVMSWLSSTNFDRNKSENAVSEISSDLAKRYTKNAKMDRDFNDDDIKRLSKSGQSTQDMHRKNSLRTKGINRAAKRVEK